MKKTCTYEPIPQSLPVRTLQHSNRWHAIMQACNVFLSCPIEHAIWIHPLREKRRGKALPYWVVSTSPTLGALWDTRITPPLLTLLHPNLDNPITYPHGRRAFLPDALKSKFPFEWISRFSITRYYEHGWKPSFSWNTTGSSAGLI